MKDKLLATVLEAAGKAVVAVGKAVTEHFAKHGSKYIFGGGAAAAGGAAYAVGEAVGQYKGKKKGTAEQAARDEEKIKIIRDAHEDDRKRWNEEIQAYENLLDEAENKL